jgi:hypothetical protein
MAMEVDKIQQIKNVNYFWGNGTYILYLQSQKEGV